MDLSRFFLTDKFLPYEQAGIMRSDYWSVYAQLYNITEGELVIGNVNNGGENKHMVFTTKDGVPVAYVGLAKHPKSKTSYWLFDSVNRPFASQPTYNEYTTTAVLRSTNIKYIAANLKKYADQIKDWAVAGRTKLSHLTRELVSSAMYEGYRALFEIPSVESLDGETRIELIKLAMGEIDRASMSPDSYRVCEIRHKEYMRQVEKREEAARQARSFVLGDKWVIVKDILGGYIIGRVGRDALLKEVETYCVSKRHSNRDHFEIHGAAWHKSLDNLPEDLKAQLMPSLMMLKVHTGSNDLLPFNEFSATTVWPAAGSVVRAYWADCPAYLIEV
jgi:hypothetical protein